MTKAYADGMLRYGVIGVGTHGESHLQCVAAAANARLAAVADLSAERAAVMSEKYGPCQVFVDYRELLAQDDVDAVSIVLPDHLHRQVCEDAFAAGKHVLVEKPLATTVADAEAIVAAQRAAGKTLMVNWSNRWMHSFAQTKAALDAGELGNPLYCYARLNNTLFVPTKMLAWAANTRLPFWLICHRYDIARWYFRSEAKRVNAVCRSVKLKSMGIDTPDFYQATVEFANGCVGNFESCWIMPESMPALVDSKFELVCSDGYVNIDAALPDFVIATHAKQLNRGTLQGDVMGEPVGFVNQAIKHFINCVLLGQEPLITGHDGLMITRALAAMVESAEKGEPVNL
ncbi:MAG: Gfo/Idh/MocA family oxidoreductase [Kiritimatiellae bacterium]|nr:Gfo/Idh/MocA family oxidoreductase [Kiritimatiellia bacterium]